jgi:hypothetical protein
MRIDVHPLRPALGLLLVLGIPGVVRAQAWLPTRGEGTIGITLGAYGFDGHFGGTGERIPYGGTRALSAGGDVTYGITDRLAVAVGLPFVTSKFTGTFPRGVLLGPLDDGDYHGDFQDFRGEVRYMAVAGDFAVTPFVGVNLPSHDYEVVGEAVPGKRTKELYLGVATGRSLEPFLPRAYFQARYFFSVVEEVVPDVDLDRSNLDLELGYSLTSRLGLRTFGAFQRTHGGLDLEDMYSRPDLFRTHDRATRTDYFNLGVGASLQATDRIQLFAAFVKTISGQNAHQARSLYLGVGLWFGGSYGKARPLAQRSRGYARPRPKACVLC